jgi:hypothetical protein
VAIRANKAKPPIKAKPANLASPPLWDCGIISSTVTVNNIPAVKDRRANITICGCPLIAKYPGVTAYGGAIYNTGNLTTDNSGFTGNNVTGTLHDSGVVSGGAIYNMGYLNIYKTTFNDNTANGHEASGGAVTNNGGSMIVKESTFTNNTAIASMGITCGP